MKIATSAQSDCMEENIIDKIIKSQETDRLLRKSMEVFKIVHTKDLPKTCDRFFNEWKILKKELIKNKKEKCPKCGKEAVCIKIKIKHKHEDEIDNEINYSYIKSSTIRYIMKCECKNIFNC